MSPTPAMSTNPLLTSAHLPTPPSFLLPSISPLLSKRSGMGTTHSSPTGPANQERAQAAVNAYVSTLESFNQRMPTCLGSSTYETAAGCASYRAHFSRITCPPLDAASQTLSATASALKCTCEATQAIDLTAFKSCADVLCTQTESANALTVVQEMKSVGAQRCWEVYNEAQKFVNAQFSGAGQTCRPVSWKSGAMVLGVVVPALVGLGGW